MDFIVGKGSVWNKKNKFFLISVLTWLYVLHNPRESEVSYIFHMNFSLCSWFFNKNKKYSKYREHYGGVNN